MRLFFVPLSALILTLTSSVLGWEPPQTAQEEMQDKWGGEIPTEIVSEPARNEQTSQ